MSKPTKKKQIKPLTQRPQDQSKRLTTAEKMMIRADLDAGMTQRAVARKYGVSKYTCHLASKDGRLTQRKLEIARVKEQLADDMLMVADQAVDQVAERIQDCNARDAAIVAGVMIDKSRLMTGDSTQNIGIKGIMGILHDNDITTTTLHFDNKPK